ncbi:hypothetical protein KAURM247S_08111 [Kitasatospora aureofaciens]
MPRWNAYVPFTGRASAIRIVQLRCNFGYFDLSCP